jgi:hypothetical protein
MPKAPLSELTGVTKKRRVEVSYPHRTYYFDATLIIEAAS